MLLIECQGFGVHDLKGLLTGSRSAGLSSGYEEQGYELAGSGATL